MREGEKEGEREEGREREIERLVHSVHFGLLPPAKWLNVFVALCVCYLTYPPTHTFKTDSAVFLVRRKQDLVFDTMKSI